MTTESAVHPKEQQDVGQPVLLVPAILSTAAVRAATAQIANGLLGPTAMPDRRTRRRTTCMETSNPRSDCDS